MKEKKIVTALTVYMHDELPEDYLKVINAAKEASNRAYAPYSNFQVGAAILLDNGNIVSGSNQENSAYPSGTCAERTAMFYANSQYPDAKPLIIAVAAQTGGAFLENPITPCGSCRQVLIESEVRYQKDITVLLYSEKAVYRLNNTKALLPLAFDNTFLV